ncbi:MAG: B12-binding domain-containing radical SAM protein [Magnetococcales bacterium]|nr:B12-binding domain-containing radical SAM protein [Magnetococcales bacterium]
MIFINPAQERFGGILSRYVPIAVPISIGYLAGVVEALGEPVAILNDELESITPDHLRQAAGSPGQSDPPVFGISMLTASAGRGYDVAAMIRQTLPNAVVVIGGLHVTLLPDEALAMPGVDYLLRGEGEETLPEFLRKLRAGEDLTAIRGLSYRDGERFVHNPQAPVIDDLDRIPPFPYHLFDPKRYDIGFVMSSRGCPHGCTYCSQRMMTGTTVRHNTTERAIADIRLLVERHGLDHIVFLDDIFTLKRSRVIELCQGLMASGLSQRCQFGIQTRADAVDPELLALLAQAGFNHIGYGMETGSDRLMQLANKGETVAEHEQVIAWTRAAGIKVSAMMIYGFPTETQEDRRAGFDVVRRMQVDVTKANNLIPYPGTPIYNDVQQSGRLVQTPGWRNFNSTLSLTRSIFDKTPLAYVPETTSEFELKREVIRYNLLNAIRWRTLSSILRREGGIGWFRLPPRWYLDPRELWEMAGIGLILSINLLIAFLPLWLTEPVMNALNPAMRQRPRVAGYRIEDHHATIWDKALTRRINQMVRRSSRAPSAPAPGE